MLDSPLSPAFLPPPSELSSDSSADSVTKESAESASVVKGAVSSIGELSELRSIIAQSINVVVAFFGEGGDLRVITVRDEYLVWSV